MMHTISLTIVLAAMMMPTPTRAGPRRLTALEHERFLEEQEDLSKQVAEWMNSDAGKVARDNNLIPVNNVQSAAIPNANSSTNSSKHDEKMHRFFLTKLSIQKFQKENPQANFSTDTPFSLMTDEEFLQHVANTNTVLPRGNSTKRLLRPEAKSWFSFPFPEDNNNIGPDENGPWPSGPVGPDDNDPDDNGSDYNDPDDNGSDDDDPTSVPVGPDSDDPTSASPGPSNSRTRTPVGPSDSRTRSPIRPDNTRTRTPVGPDNTPTPTDRPVVPSNSRTRTPVDPDNTPTSTPGGGSGRSSNGSGTKDWTTSKCVAPPRQQLQCGSSWAFAAISVLETANCLKTGKLQAFSEQHLVSCDRIDYGCQGGLTTSALKFVKQNGGACTAESYPYTSGRSGQNGQCESSKCQKVDLTIQKLFQPQPTEQGFIDALNKMPLMVAVAVGSTWKQYRGGVMTSCQNSQMNHAVVAVGYGSDHFKIKNSWGTQWGDGGYLKLSRKGSNCGIFNDAPVYPVI